MREFCSICLCFIGNILLFYCYWCEINRKMINFASQKYYNVIFNIESTK